MANLARQRRTKKKPELPKKPEGPPPVTTFTGSDAEDVGAELSAPSDVVKDAPSAFAGPGKKTRKRQRKDPEPKKLDLGTATGKLNFTFALSSDLDKQVKKRQERVEAEESDSGDDEEVGVLRLLSSSAKKAKVDKKYPKEKGKGNVHPFDYRDVSFDGRLDKVSGSIYPRIAAKGEKDKTTLELASALDDIDEDYHDQFLKAVRGEDFDEADVGSDLDTDRAEKAHRAGTEARVIGLGSDVIDHPGSSALSGKLLEKVTTPEQYEALFTGPRFESSYGALPSQNINTSLEPSAQRIKVYSNIGTLIDKGSLDITSAPSNIPTLRKVRSIVGADPSLLDVRVSQTARGKKQKADSEQFLRFVDRQAILERHSAKQKKFSDQEIFSDPEEDSDDERDKYSVLTRKESEQLRKSLLAKQKKLQRKLRLLGEEADEDGESEEER